MQDRVMRFMIIVLMLNLSQSASSIVSLVRGGKFRRCFKHYFRRSTITTFSGCRHSHFKVQGQGRSLTFIPYRRM